jgi:predicted RNA binding protein YcfA (HicA-like mRNA interferase family)
MSKLPQVTARNMIAALKRAGFIVDRTKGSHHFMIHEADPSRWATVPVRPGDLRNDTVRDILESTRLSREEFLRLL